MGKARWPASVSCPVVRGYCQVWPAWGGGGPGHLPYSYLYPVFSIFSCLLLITSIIKIFFAKWPISLTLPNIFFIQILAISNNCYYWPYHLLIDHHAYATHLLPHQVFKASIRFVFLSLFSWWRNLGLKKLYGLGHTTVKQRTQMWIKSPCSWPPCHPASTRPQNKWTLFFLYVKTLPGKTSNPNSVRPELFSDLLVNSKIDFLSWRGRWGHFFLVYYQNQIRTTKVVTSHGNH